MHFCHKWHQCIVFKTLFGIRFSKQMHKQVIVCDFSHRQAVYRLAKRRRRLRWQQRCWDGVCKIHHGPIAITRPLQAPGQGIGQRGRVIPLHKARSRLSGAFDWMG